MRHLVDTHILLRWLNEPRRLSAGQNRVLKEAHRRGEVLGISDISLLEIAVLANSRLNRDLGNLLTELENSPAFHVLPVTYEVALEVASLGPFLRDPADRGIVATARVHRLTLVTSDQRIIESGLVSCVE